MKRYVIDSYAMMAYFEDEPGVLNDIVHGKSHGYMSIINWGEIYYNTFRVQGRESAEMVLSQLERYPIELVDVDRSLAYEAAKFKAEFKIAYADCFAAALATRLNAKVLTGDKEFRRLEEKIHIKWIV